MVFLEAPHRLAVTLAAMAGVLGDTRSAAVCRELTKTYEEVRSGGLRKLATWAADGVKGEITVVVGGAPVRVAELSELVTEVQSLVVAVCDGRRPRPEVAAAHGTAPASARSTAHSQPLTGLTDNQTYHYRVVSRDAAGNTATSADKTFVTANASATAATKGQWSSAMNWPLVAVHMIPMYTGEILMFDAWEIPAKPKVWNPVTNTFYNVPNSDGIFCSAHVTLADGRILIAGGHALGGAVG